MDLPEAVDAAAAKEQMAQARDRGHSAARHLDVRPTALRTNNTPSFSVACSQLADMRKDARERMSALLEIASTSAKVAKAAEAALGKAPSSGGGA